MACAGKFYFLPFLKCVLLNLNSLEFNLFQSGGFEYLALLWRLQSFLVIVRNIQTWRLGLFC